MSLHLNEIDPAKLEQLQGKVINDVAGSLGLLMAYIGDKLDLYSALLEISPATSQQLIRGTKNRWRLANREKLERGDGIAGSQHTDW
jgi:hypothetical protein